jgi:hypothetical protein
LLLNTAAEAALSTPMLHSHVPIATQHGTAVWWHVTIVVVQTTAIVVIAAAAAAR